MTVHVMCPPENALKSNERLCLQPDLGQGVVFHVNSERVGKHWRCPDCGATTAEKV